MSSSPKYNLNSLEIITYGAEPMPSYTLKLISKLFKNVKLLQTYGLIELGVIRSKSESNNSLWFKIEDDNYRTKIIDDILYIKTDSAMLGYLNAPSPFDSNGWFITGDKVLVKNEYIKVLGRESDIINIGGEKVYPQEIENIIRQIDNVIDVTVYGESNLIVGQIICAKINIREKENIKSFISKVKIECKKELPSYKIPIKFFIEDSKLYNNRFKKQRKT
jgi:acyl-CoA synthetase (AMP-forming)/AMP-acid ligase II